MSRSADTHGARKAADKPGLGQAGAPGAAPPGSPLSPPASPLSPLAPLAPIAANPRRHTPVPAYARWLKRSWDQLSLYLPVLLMAALAAASYWIVARSPEPRVPEPRAELAGPDTTMRKVTLRDFDAQGQLRLLLQGQQVQHFPADGRLEAVEVRLRQRDAQGQWSQAEAERLSSNAERSVLRLSGNVVLQQAGQTFRSQALTVYTLEDRVVSEAPVQIERAGQRISAERMTYDQRTGRLLLSGRVRSTWAAPR